MITRKQSVTLGLAICLSFGIISTVALTLGRTAPAFAKPMKGKLLRRKNDVHRTPDPKERAALRGQNQDRSDKREVKIRSFGEMPLKVHEIRNKDADTWYKDLQIEVKNIGTKPIYFMLAYLEFPDHKPGGRDIGFDLTYGELKYVDLNVVSDTRDLHLNPGQTYVFKITAKDARVLQRKHERAPHEFKKLDFHIDIISFGDRTGFEIGRPLDLRKVKTHHGKRILTASVRNLANTRHQLCGLLVSRTIQNRTK